MYDRFEAEIYRHASCQSGQVLILERDTEGKGKGLCLGWWQAKLCQKDWPQQSMEERNSLTSQDNQQNM